MKLQHFTISIIAAAFGFGMLACKDKSAAPKPTPKAATAGGEDPGEGETTAPGGEEDLQDELSLELNDSSEDFKYQPGNAISIKFNIVGASSSDDIIVGLSELPSGSSMETSGKTVTFSWTSPTAGSHSFRFVLRNKAACVEAEGSASDCSIDESDYGDIDVKSYDTTSTRYTLDVSSGTDSTTNTTNTNSGNNSQIIQQITGLLGGGGGGNITQILQGLGGGQLQQLLGLLQGGGAGLDINQLLPLLGIQLTGDQPVKPGERTP